jgi:hypothetical protein
MDVAGQEGLAQCDCYLPHRSPSTLQETILTKIRREVTTMRTVKRTRPMLTILAALAVVMGIATASIQSVPAGEDTACSRGDRAPTCMH